MVSRPSLGLLFATIDRPHAAQRLIKSVREYFPDMAIYVADQSKRSRFMEDFYSSNKCDVVWMDHDAGVCESRNAALGRVKEDFFVLCDDDFILMPETRFGDALAVLAHNPEVGVVGGHLIDITQVDEKISENDRSWELYFEYDQRNKLLVTVPINALAPDPRYSGGVKFYLCDAVLNFAVFRRSIFDDVVRWDPTFKSNGEHEDFYLNLKLNSHHRVAYVPTMVAQHHPPPTCSYLKLRARNLGWLLFMRKWHIAQHYELNWGVRTIADVETMITAPLAWQEFLTARSLTASTARARRPALEIVDEEGRVLPANHGIADSAWDVPAQEFAKFSVGMKGEIASNGGYWTRTGRNDSPGREERATAVKSGMTTNVSAAEAAVQYFPMTAPGSDFYAFVRPVNFTLSLAREDPWTVLVSWRAGADYLVFRRPLRSYGMGLAAGAWNAVALNPPSYQGLLTFELTLMRRDDKAERMIASGDIFLTEPSGTMFQSAVSAWAPFSKKISLNAKSPQGRDDTRVTLSAVQHCSGRCGERLQVLEIRTDDLGPRDNAIFLNFRQFPYEFGAGRGRCFAYFDHLEPVRFLIPYSMPVAALTIDVGRYDAGGDTRLGAVSAQRLWAGELILDQ